MPESRSSLAVPPVEMSSMPRLESVRAKSTRPVLSVTLRMARWILEWLEDMTPSDMEDECGTTEDCSSYRFGVLRRSFVRPSGRLGPSQAEVIFLRL